MSEYKRQKFGKNISVSKELIHSNFGAVVKLANLAVDRLAKEKALIEYDWELYWMPETAEDVARNISRAQVVARGLLEVAE